VLLILHGGLLLVAPSLISLAAAILLWVALKKVATLRKEPILYGVVLCVATFLTVAGALLLWLSSDELWYLIKYSFANV
jgi:hypothetical protein